MTGIGTIRASSSSSYASPAAAEGSDSSTGLVSISGMMRIPPPGAGATRISPREISRRIMAWTSGRWAFT